MEAKPHAETLQGQIVSTDAEARSPANEPARAGPVDEIPSPTEAEKMEPELEKKDIQEQQAPITVASLEAGLAAVEISPSSSPSSASTGRHSPSGFPRSDYVPPLPGTGMDATNVFIKYLPTDLTNTGLFTLFSQFGEITSCKVMVDPITGYSLGYGFVRFSSSDEAANAITNMYGTTIGSKTLLCKLSHGIPQNNATPSDNLYIKPLLDTTSEADLLGLFSPHGRVLECKVMMDKNTGQSRQIGFVRFATIEEATKALAANNGRYLTEDAPPMVVKYAESRAQKIARRAKLLANQAAAESRRNQLKYQQSQHTADLYAQAEAGEGSLADGTASESHVPGAEVSTPASMPYIVKDEYGNVTFAPDLEQVEEAAAAVAAAVAATTSPATAGNQDLSSHHGFWPTPAAAAAYPGPQPGTHGGNSHVAHHHHHQSGGSHNGEGSRPRRGGGFSSRRGGAGGNSGRNTSGRPMFQPYHHTSSTDESSDGSSIANGQDEASDATQASNDSYSPSGHHGGRNSSGGGGGAVYRKKGSAPAGNARHQHQHHNNHHQQHQHHQHQQHQQHNQQAGFLQNGTGPLPTFSDSPMQRVQLAGKVEVGQNGDLVAPEWADDPTRLFISHLPPDYDASALQALFESHGSVVSAKISQDKRSARPKTYGFVQYALSDNAAKAVKELHGTVVDGRAINVAYEATQSVAKHKHEQQMYYMQQASQMSYSSGSSSHLPPPPHHVTGGGGNGRRRGGGGGRGRGSRMPFYPPYAYQGYPEMTPDGAPYVPYVVDPATGAPMAPYPVYYPGMMPYTPEGMIPLMVPPHLAAEPYYPSSGRESPQTGA